MFEEKKAVILKKSYANNVYDQQFSRMFRDANRKLYQLNDVFREEIVRLKEDSKAIEDRINLITTEEKKTSFSRKRSHQFSDESNESKSNVENQVMNLDSENRISKQDGNNAGEGNSGS